MDFAVPSLTRSLKQDKGRDPFNQTSNRSDREKRTTSKGGPVFSKLFRLDRTDPLSFGPKFPESLVEWIAPRVFKPVDPGISSDRRTSLTSNLCFQEKRSGLGNKTKRNDPLYCKIWIPSLKILIWSTWSSGSRLTVQVIQAEKAFNILWVICCYDCKSQLLCSSVQIWII